MCIFGAVTGTTLRYYAREMIVSVIVLIVTMSYAIGFIFAITQDNNKTNLLEYYETFFVPITVILPVTCLVAGMGYYLIHKINIGS
jgi:hypothetical protein